MLGLKFDAFRCKRSTSALNILLGLQAPLQFSDGFFQDLILFSELLELLVSVGLVTGPCVVQPQEPLGEAAAGGSDHEIASAVDVAEALKHGQLSRL